MATGGHLFCRRASATRPISIQPNRTRDKASAARLTFDAVTPPQSDDLRSCFGADGTRRDSAFTLPLGRKLTVHFLDVGLLDAVWASLVLGGRLYIETFGGHGKNYLDLPKAGQLRDSLSRHFKLAFYRERKVGPPNSDAVSVKLLGKKL